MTILHFFSAYYDIVLLIMGRSIHVSLFFRYFDDVFHYFSCFSNYMVQPKVIMSL